MPIGEICNREVVFARRNNTIKEAASLMRQHHVGDLVVVDEGSVRKPVGIITDRDIVVSLVALGLDADTLTVGEVMGQDLSTAPEQQGIFESIEQMRARGIRRLPVVGKQGELIGIVAVDDLIGLLAEEMGDLAKIIAREQTREVKTRR
jgi:CBS domain-containing protein